MKKFSYFFLFLFTLIIFSVSSTYAQTSNTSLFIKAKQYSLDGKYDKAVEILNKILQSEKSMYIYDFLIENQLNAKKIDDALVSTQQAYKAFPKETKYLFLEASIYKEYKMNFKKAYELMQKCIEISPTDEYLFHTAVLAGTVKDYKKAESILNDLIKKNPEKTQYYMVRADTYSQQKKTSKAIKDLEKAVSIDNNNTAKLMLAEIYLEQKKEDKAIAILEEVAKDNKNISTFVEQNIGKIYRDKGDFDKAIEVYKRLADKLYGSSKAVILMQLGDALNMAGRYEEAGKVFEEITTLVPNEITYYYIAGKFYEYTKNYKKAEELYKGALKINPTYAQVLKRITVVYLLQDRTKEALKYINMVDELEQDVDYYLLKAECFSIDKNFKEVIKILEKGLKENPTNTQILALLASAYEETGDRQTALKYIEKANKLEPDNHIIQNFLGFLYAELNMNLDEALKLIEKALTKEPDNAAYLDSLGWVYYKKKDYKKAYKYITRAVELMPEEQELRDHLEAVKKAMKK